MMTLLDSGADLTIRDEVCMLSHSIILCSIVETKWSICIHTTKMLTIVSIRMLCREVIGKQNKINLLVIISTTSNHSDIFTCTLILLYLSDVDTFSFLCGAELHICMYVHSAVLVFFTYVCVNSLILVWSSTTSPCCK